MATDHQASQRVYVELKRDVLAGQTVGHLHIGALALRYATSVTPVREAMLRLVGERLIAVRSAGGFIVIIRQEQEVRNLYAYNMELALLASAWTNGDPVDILPPHDEPHGLDPPIDVFFSALAARTSNIALVAAIGTVNDQLCRIRRAEQGHLTGLAQEFTKLEQLAESGAKVALHRALRTYHRRRIRHARALAQKIQIEDLARSLLIT